MRHGNHPKPVALHPTGRRPRPRATGLRLNLGLVLAILGPASQAHADMLALIDGSQVNGELVRLDGEALVFRTGFAGDLRIERSKVAGLSTDDKVVTALTDGSRLIGRLDYDAAQGQALSTELVGPVKLSTQQIAAAWRPQDKSPEMLDMEQAAEAHAQEMEAIQAAQREPHELWSGALEFGLAGADGNTEKQDVNGKVVTKRETDFDRLELALEGRSASNQGSQTEAEIIASASLERDFSERWFTFGKASFERDKFEDIDLRATLSSGVGYFLIKKPDHVWKPQGGIGYQFEATETGPNEGEFVLSMGYDYWIRLFGKTRFGHKLTYLPTFDDPGADYRAESEFSLSHPLTQDEAWSIGASLRHQYDALPPVGVRKLDTFYKLNIGYAFE